MPPPIRVGLVDDHPAIVASLAAAVDAAADLVLVGTADAVAAAIALGRRVDVLVCDIQLDGHAEGLDVLAAVHRPDGPGPFRPPAVLMLSGFDQPSLLRAALERGAAGFLDKSADLPRILAAIRTIADGGTVFSARALRTAGAAHRRPSAREIQVLTAVAGGATNGEVAQGLGLSEKTVESHLRRMFDRYGVQSRTELAVLALDEGWIPDRRAP